MTVMLKKGMKQMCVLGHKRQCFILLLRGQQGSFVSTCVTLWNTDLYI